MTQPPHKPTRPLDAVIFGGGLAGSLLAYRLRRDGLATLLVDDPAKSRCSRVAAGLINPIGGRRLKQIWLADTLIPYAKANYQQLAEELGQTFFHPRSIHRAFANSQEATTWQKRAKDPAHERWVSSSTADHFTIPDAGYLDTHTLLGALHSHLAAQGCLLSSTFKYDEIYLNPGGIAFRGITARYAIFAEGHLATANPHFSFVPYKPAKGIIASISLSTDSSPLPAPEQIFIKGKFIVPRHDGAYQVGATYKWNDPSDTPDPEGIEELRQFLDATLGPQKWTFEQIKAGVRPATAGAYPVVGPHPELSSIIAFNGFGSKGSLQIPYFADALARFLQDQDSPLPAEVLPARFAKGKANPKPKRWLATDIARDEVLKHLQSGGLAIDATAGNGHDAAWLAEAVGPEGHVFVFDIQESALAATEQRLAKLGHVDRTTIRKAGHENLLQEIPNSLHGRFSAIVFNLGFLPGGDPSLITRSDTTIQGLKAGLQLLKPGGILSVTLYPAHNGAVEEVRLVLSWLNSLPAESYHTRVEHHPKGNKQSPFPAFVVKRTADHSP